MRLRSRLLQLLLCLIVVVAALWVDSSAIAAEKVVLKYKIFRGSVSVSELTTFAQTGQVSPALQFYLRVSRQKPENVRRALTEEVPANVATLDWALNNPAGNLLLDQVDLLVHPPTNVANREPIRSALVASASQDSKVSLMEVIQNYPTPVVEIEGERILQTYREFSVIEDQVRNIIQN
jgi:Alpha/beta hydrolase of unknown function (DUF1400)